MNGRRILVTGGAGFIGTNFVYYWVKRHPQDSITVLDKLTYAGHLENIRPLVDAGKVNFVHGDICDEQAVDSTMREVDAVVHFAAETHVDRSLSGLEGKRVFYRTNIEGTETLLESARTNGIRRFLHVSTDEVFGDLDYDDPTRFHEKSAYNPHSPYAVSKSGAEWAARAFMHTWGEPEVLITNCTNNYGPFQTPEKVIPRSISLLLAGEKIKLYTDASGTPGRNVRDWLHVEDHCSALEAVLLRGRAGETYCVGGDTELSNYQLVEKMLAIMSELTGKNMDFQTHVEFVKDRPGHDRRYAMDTSKIKQELGWFPVHSFEEGFKQTVAWYISPRGREWLEYLNELSREVRIGQDSKERK